MTEEEAEKIVENYNPRLSDVMESGTADEVINKLEVFFLFYVSNVFIMYIYICSRV
jgi:hypothetical protein